MIASNPDYPTIEEAHHYRALIGRLQKAKIFLNYQRAFQAATGLPLVLRPVGTFQEPLRGAKRINPFCALMASTSKTCAVCLQMQERFEKEAIGDSKTLECFAGFSESVVPIHLGETVIGFLQTGQVLLHSPSEKNFRAAVDHLSKTASELELSQWRKAYFDTRILAPSVYESMVRLLTSFAQHLSIVCNELTVRQASAEPLAIRKARVFIAEHLDEELTLASAARMAGMSSYYFCKVFRKASGLTFTDYVARARVGRAKQLLLNPQMHVSESAFAAGFQSLSQFNRVFRRIEGRAPSAWRDLLPDGAATGRLHRTFSFAA